MSSKQKYYVVWKGRKTGIFNSWEECKDQVHGFEGALYKSFHNKILAEEAFKKWKMENGKWKMGKLQTISDIYTDLKLQTTNYKPPPNIFDKPILESISVDASCIENPGPMEYRGVYTKTGEELFRKSFKYGTNNIGEFLAIVHALAYLKKKSNPYLDSGLPIYSDSGNAISWVKNKKAKTKLKENEKSKEFFEVIHRAEKWLQENNYSNKILKWNTELWGEILADFGRK